MRIFPPLLAGLCALFITDGARADMLSVYGTDMAIEFDPALFDLPASTAFNVNDYQVYARSETDGLAISETGATSFRLKLTNPDVRVVAVTLVQSGQYSLAGSASEVGASGSMGIVGVGKPGATAQSAYIDSQPLLRDSNLHAWSMLSTLYLRGDRWADIDALDISVQSRLWAYAPATLGTAAYINEESTLRRSTTEFVSGSGFPGSPVATTPLPQAALLLGSGLLALFAWARSGRHSACATAGATRLRDALTSIR